MKRISRYTRALLVRALKEVAKAEMEGRSLPARALATALGMSESSGLCLRRDLQGIGWLAVHDQGGGGHPSRTSVTEAGWDALGGRSAVAPQRKTRTCMLCGAEFLSEGPGHRFCDCCRSTDAFQAGAETAYQVVLP